MTLNMSSFQSFAVQKAVITDKLQYTSVTSALSRIISCSFLRTAYESDTGSKQSDAVVITLKLLQFSSLLQRLYY